jgi:hypothetical protein
MGQVNYDFLSSISKDQVDHEFLQTRGGLVSINMDKLDNAARALLSSISMDQVAYKILPPGALPSYISPDQTNCAFLPLWSLLSSINLYETYFDICRQRR